MSLRTIASLAVALVLGLVAVVLVRGFLITNTPVMRSSAATSPVVVAAAPIAHGTKLQSGMLKVVNYPADALPSGAFTSVGEVVGKAGTRVAVKAIAVNEPLLSSKLSGEGARGYLSGQLEPGMRAVSVRSSDVAGVAGFITPGDRVDILVTRVPSQGGDQSALTQVLAENALVLGVDQTTEMDADKPVVTKTVTIQVTPAQAQQISLGQTIGQVTLSLRGIGDGAAEQSRETRVSDLEAVTGHPQPVVKVAHPMASKPRPRAISGLVQVHVTRGVEVADYSLTPQ